MPGPGLLPIEGLDVAGKVAVVRSERRPNREEAEVVVAELTAAGASLVIFLEHGAALEALDDDGMRAGGWVRAEDLPACVPGLCIVDQMKGVTVDHHPSCPRFARG